MQIMAIWTMNACIQADICHDLYGEVTTFVKLELRSNGFTNGVLNSYLYLYISVTIFGYSSLPIHKLPAELLFTVYHNFSTSSIMQNRSDTVHSYLVPPSNLPLAANISSALLIDDTGDWT